MYLHRIKILFLQYKLCHQAVMLLAPKIFLLLYFQPIDRPLPPNQRSRLLSFNTVDRIWYQIQSRTRFILIPVYFKTLKMNVKMILLILYNPTIIGQHYIMQNVSSCTKTDQASIITNRQYYDLDLITEIYLFTATSLSLFYSSNTLTYWSNHNQIYNMYRYIHICVWPYTKSKHVLSIVKVQMKQSN